MLPSSQRLRAKEVALVLKKGRGLKGGKYISSAKVFFPEENTKGNATMRCAVVVSLKVARTNAARSLVRRIAYAAVQEITKKPNMSIRPAHVVLFIRSLPGENMQSEFMFDLKKILRPLMANG